MSIQSRRLVVYAVGPSGLGQTVRALRLVDHVVEGGGDVQATVITAIPGAHRLLAARHVATVVAPTEVVRLAGLVREGASANVLLETAYSATTRLSALVEALRPDVFVTTTHRGVAGELTPILRRLNSAGCRIVLALRDIYQPPRFERDFDEMSPEDFQRVLVAGPPALARWLPRGLRFGPIKQVVSFEGYLRPPAKAKWLSRREHEVVVLCHVGGGRDGRSLLEAAMSVIDDFRVANANGARLIVSTGPLMGEAEVSAIRKLANGTTTEVHTWWGQKPTDGAFVCARPDLVISMAGYNSCVEAATGTLPTVLVPRVDITDTEQEIRARLFSGWFDHIEVVQPGSAVKLQAVGAELLQSVVPRATPNSFAPRHMFASAKSISASLLGSSL